MDDIIITTTPSIEGHQIKEYMGLVFSKGGIPTMSLLGDAKKDKDIGNQRTLMESLADGLRREAEILNANAVVSVKFHYEKASLVTTLPAILPLSFSLP